MDSEILSSTSAPAGTVQCIDKSTVHRICSGQVVLTLATAVKELVENSLDAGATCIEVRLKNSGSELVEVVDNGHGIEECDFQTLTLKHYTSKLKEFRDLVNVETFGFRGEALSSLAALSKLTITTCHKNAAIGTKLEYDHDGILIKQTPCARQAGTTISVANLFSTLPVRFKEFNHNLKKEFHKMAQVLYGYCLISTGVRISCVNQNENGKKSTIVATEGVDTIKQNISSVFGVKQINSLLKFTQVDPATNILEEYSLKIDDSKRPPFNIEGFMSSCEHGQGRSSTDRQFIFINGRPVDPPKIVKVVNEVYHSFNRNQYPMVVLSITIDEKESVDINVTPDKRQVFLSDEKILLATLKSSLITLFEHLPSTVKIQQNFIPISVVSSNSLSAERYVERKTLNLQNFKRPFPASSQECRSTQSSPKQPKLDSFFSKISPKFKSTSTVFQTGKQNIKEDNTIHINNTTQSNEQHSTSVTKDHFEDEQVDDNLEQNGIGNPNNDSDDNVDFIEIVCIENNKNSSFNGTTQPFKLTHQEESCQNNENVVLADSMGKEHVLGLPNKNEMESPLLEQTSNYHQPELPISGADSLPIPDLPCGTESTGYLLQREASPTQSSNDVVILDTEYSPVEKRTHTVQFDMEKLKSYFHRLNVKSSANIQRTNKFKAKILPSDNSTAEQELKKEISKDMFSKMAVVGQFNLGFIITKLNFDVFIIDQHATDEKYNYESLQQSVVMNTQKLIIPQTLELTPSNEMVLLDNLPVFKKNGFDFSIDEDECPTKRVKLTSVPYSRNWTFGSQDVEELIFMLSDTPGVMCWPSRMLQMFASRACRKSVMVGSALSKTDMSRLVTHMGEIEQPWNCPHGRPTIRHLVNLDMIQPE